MITDSYTLYNGVKIPKLGFGTWMIDNDAFSRLVKEAINIGYRHIDTAEAYGNEEGVGLGIKQSGIDRENIFITTKLHAEIKNYEEAVHAINISLEKLGVEYIDLMLIHSPKPWSKFLRQERYFEGNLAAWKAMEKFYKEGKLKAIGVSNFDKEDVDNIIRNSEIKPMVNQLLAHIGSVPFELIEYLKEQDILIQAYSPFGHGDIFKNEKLKIIAGKYNVSVAQLSLKYLLQLGLAPLPKSTKLKPNTRFEGILILEDLFFLTILYFKSISLTLIW